MHTELRHENGYYSLYVNGRKYIDQESFAVADQVRYHLENPEAFDTSETSDVAESIRMHKEIA